MIELVLDTMLPGDAALGVPNASAIDFEGYQLRHRITQQVDAFLGVLTRVAHERFGRGFETLDATSRLAAINACKLADVRVFSAFVTHAMRAYYTDRIVLNAISAGPVPPFPAGAELPADDWTILEPVYERGPIWRAAAGIDAGAANETTGHSDVAQ
ncbi:gluconate 2-dehydrogenase subunit 3 family protein [Paraburkholderia sp. Ac-20340]|uniref:hypothetical protein n=1 Tax=Paraburkholderia sp. Ac-20340 TaxID=2703888 RepID=UPI00197CD42F|nr:hypothetical protein [Paraburkholderia sp. Ac-20340]MBN3854490.1 gluconate 2-dehydrogenase subunit 3 family protein [Paraburkholderia sp. Ac-20340]